MKRINESDAVIRLPRQLYDADNFTVLFYAANPSVYISKTKADVVITENGEYLYPLDWIELQTLGSGVLQFRYYGGVADATLIDNELNTYREYTAEYYIVSSVTPTPEPSSGSSGYDYAVITEILRTIANEKTRATSAETELNNNITAETAIRQQNVSDLTDIINGEILRATAAENVISGVVDTKLDFSAYTPTDLTNYYTKNEVDQAITSIDYVSAATFNAYSSATHTKVDAISGVVDTKLDITAYTPTDLTNYYTKQEIEDKNYLTTHQSLSDYYTKDEIEGKNYLTTHQSLENYYTKPQIIEIVEQIEGGGSGEIGDIVCGDWA